MPESDKNCIDVIQPFLGALDIDRRCEEYVARSTSEGHLSDFNHLGVQIIGGINTVALEHQDTIIDVKKKEVIAPGSLYLPTHRENGSLRDLDVLVQSDKSLDIEHIKAIASVAIGRSLELSVFGFKQQEVLRRQLRHPFGFTALKTFLSDRYILDDGDEKSLVKSLFPFSVPLDKESLETWHLVVGEHRMPILNPAASVINYTNRSITGVRPKDQEKVSRVVGSIFAKAPELRDWAVDGPGATQVALGELLKSLTPSKDHPNYFGVSSKLLSHSELAAHEFFMLPELDDKRKLRIVGLAAIKAGILSFGESNTQISTFWQRHIERHADVIVKNE